MGKLRERKNVPIFAAEYETKKNNHHVYNYSRNNQESL